MLDGTLFQARGPLYLKANAAKACLAKTYALRSNTKVLHGVLG